MNKQRAVPRLSLKQQQGSNEMSLASQRLEPSRLALKRLFKIDCQEKNVMTNMFGNRTLDSGREKKSMSEHTSQDYSGYILNLALKEVLEKEENPFLRAKLRVVLRKDSENSQKQSSGSTYAASLQEETNIYDQETENEQITMKLISLRQKSKKNQVLKDISRRCI